MKSIIFKPFHGLLFCLALITAMPISILQASELSEQASPYLRTHAKDAVKWRTFTPEAFEEAKNLNKPILLSSGYLSCYWCHRMAEDSFRQRSVGEAINNNYLPILLDREMEPEVDAYLQAFMTQQRGFGGWPLTVILTPHAKPVAGFSYQNAEATLQTLSDFAMHWSKQRSAVETSAQNKAKRLEAQPASQESTQKINTRTLLNNFLAQTERIADNDFGGFGQTEKFPFAPQLATLLNIDRAQNAPQLRTFLQTTLQAMLGSGLRDHVGGGFFRYSDTREWSAPHFEQMLHTQALMAPLLLQAGKQWKNPAYVKAGREVILAMVNHFQRSDGLFRAALSAVSEDGVAGGYYLWTETALRKILGEQYSAIYPLPLSGQSHYLPLIRVNDNSRLQVRQRLLTARQARQLKTDDKALLGWNGLALSALAAGIELAPSIRLSGERLVERLKPLLANNRLPRLIDASEAGPAQLADQIYLAQGLYDWARATQNKSLKLQAAKQIHVLFQRYFYQGNWQAAINKPLIGELRSAALVDNELPSPSGLWLKLVNQILYDTKPLEKNTSALITTDLRSALETVTQHLTDELEDNAFFHGTTLTALLQIATLKNQPQETKE